MYYKISLYHLYRLKFINVKLLGLTLILHHVVLLFSIKNTM